jgi:hypothetical protein
MRNTPSSLYGFVKGALAARKSFPWNGRSKLVLSKELYGAMIGYTLATPPAVEGNPWVCRTVIANMGSGGPYDIAGKHAAPECGNTAFREAFVAGNTSRRTGTNSTTYSVAPYGGVVLDTP